MIKSVPTFTYLLKLKKKNPSHVLDFRESVAIYNTHHEHNQ